MGTPHGDTNQYIWERLKFWATNLALLLARQHPDSLALLPPWHPRRSGRGYVVATRKVGGRTGVPGWVVLA